MWRIVCYVDDKHMETALRSLINTARHVETPVPVANAVPMPREGGGKIKAISSGNSADVVWAELSASGAASVNRKQIAEILERSGYKGSSNEWVRKKLIDAGCLGATSTKGVFNILAQPTGRRIARKGTPKRRTTKRVAKRAVRPRRQATFDHDLLNAAIHAASDNGK